MAILKIKPGGGNSTGQIKQSQRPAGDIRRREGALLVGVREAPSEEVTVERRGEGGSQAGICGKSIPGSRTGPQQSCDPVLAPRLGLCTSRRLVTEVCCSNVGSAHSSVHAHSLILPYAFQVQVVGWKRRKSGNEAGEYGGLLSLA